MYVTLKDVNLVYRDSTLNESLNLIIKWIQVDNQLYGGLEPIVLYPSVLSKEGQDIELHPVISSALMRSKDTCKLARISHGWFVN